MNLLSGERLRLYITFNIIRGFMFDAKVNNGVNGIKRTTLTRVNTPKRRIILGHFVAGIVLLVFQIQRVFTFPQKKVKRVRICES